MLPLPPLSLTGGMATGGTAGGAGAWSTGDWNINLGGSAPSLQGLAAGSLSPWLIGAVVLGAAWLMLRK